MKLTKFTFIICLSFSISSAFAGEVLRMKAGNFYLDGSLGTIDLQPAQPSTTGENYFVVQFKNAITEADKASLTRMGLEPKGYLPEDALIVKASIADAQNAAFLNGVTGLSAFQPEWKISEELYSMPNHAKDFVYVTLMEGTDSLLIAREMKLAGITVTHIAQDAIVARISRNQVPTIANIEGTEWIQIFPIFMTFDYNMNSEVLETPASTPAITGYESGTKIMNFDAAWKRGFKGEGQVVGMADTGADSGQIATMHQDLKAIIKGYAFGFGSTSWEDMNGHGTHVAGSVVGNGAASSGEIKGGAPLAQMTVGGLWSPIMNNLAFNNDFNVLLGAPYEDGVRIHTNSWGSPQNPGGYDAFAMNVDKYIWAHPDMLVLFAAGNDGKDLNADGRVDEGSMATPATAKNVLTVGASENLLATGGIQKPHGQLREGDKKWGTEPVKSDTLSNNPDGLACFSSRGPTKDGRTKPDVVAPGTNIVSTKSFHPKAGLLWGEFSKDYLYAGGTSMATPLTAGAATVAREYLIKAKGQTAPSAALLKATLIHTAKDMFPGQYGRGMGQELPTARPNVHEGYGRVDMDSATNLTNTIIVDEKSGLGVNAEAAVNVQVTQGSSLRATLVYTDAPGSTSAAKALVNDLDLQIISPSKAVKQLGDRTNNVEMIEMTNLSGGNYQIVVKGINIPQGANGKQPYALLVTQY